MYTNNLTQNLFKLGAICITFILYFTTLVEAQPAKQMLYVGSFAGKGSEGVYVFEFDSNTAVLKLIQTQGKLEGPNFLYTDKAGKNLYAVTKAPAEEASSGGAVAAFAIDRSTGKLNYLNHQPSYGRGPCHIQLDHKERWAFVSNYSEGNVVAMAIGKDGRVGAKTDAKQHTGSSVNPERQEGPHVHSAIVSPDNRYLYVSDLGTDKVFCYVINAATGQLTPAATPFVQVAPGAGPRHLKFHPNRRFAYLVEELTSTVAVFSYDKASGKLTLIQDLVKSLPTYFKAFNKAAEIQIDPKGKFLYMSNRGYNSLAIYAIAPDGKINLVGQQETLGSYPRNFILDSKGKFVIVANEESNNIVVFRRDAQTGKLTYTGQQVTVTAPGGIRLLQLK